MATFGNKESDTFRPAGESGSLKANIKKYEIKWINVAAVAELLTVGRIETTTKENPKRDNPKKNICKNISNLFEFGNRLIEHIPVMMAAIKIIRITWNTHHDKK